MNWRYFMRIDKFLKLSRLVKRRSVAQEKISIGAVRINGRVCKSSSHVHKSDSVEVAYTARVLQVEILLEDEKELKKRGSEPYRLISETRIDPDERPW